MSTELQTTVQLGAQERALLMGDISKLTESERGDLYSKLCSSLKLNPLTNPFSYMQLNNKWMFYANRSCTDQLRSINGISIVITKRETIGDCYAVTAQAVDPTGRKDESTGVVVLAGKTGANLANAYMVAETKAKRRVTLSICGLGFMDESELDTVPQARVAQRIETPPPMVVELEEPEELTELRKKNEEMLQSFESTGEIPKFDSQMIEASKSRETGHINPSKLAQEMVRKEREEKVKNYAPSSGPEYKFAFGKFAGQTIRDVGIHNAENYYAWLCEQAKQKGREPAPHVIDLGHAIQALKG